MRRWRRPGSSSTSRAPAATAWACGCSSSATRCSPGSTCARSRALTWPSSSRETGESATLSAPGEHEAVTVDFVQSAASVQYVARLGRPSVAHATAVGKVFLANGGKLPGGPLPVYTPRTITERKALAAEVALVAKRGFAEALGERESDLNAVAAPVFGPHRELMAILGVQGPASRFGRPEMEAAVRRLLEHAAAISAKLGYAAEPFRA